MKEFTSDELSKYIGIAGELVLNKDTNTTYLMDGTKPGGISVPNAIITIQGLPGIGKSTIANRIAEMLKREFGIEAILSDEIKNDTTGKDDDEIPSWLKKTIQSIRWCIEEKLF